MYLDGAALELYFAYSWMMVVKRWKVSGKFEEIVLLEETKNV